MEQANSDSTKVSFKDALFGTDYWRGTWVAAGVAICIQLSCNVPVVMFSSIIFMRIDEATKGEFSINPQLGAALTGGTWLLGAFISPVCLKQMGRKTNMIVGHVTEAVFLVLLTVFYMIG